MKPILSCEEVRRLEDCIEAEGTSKATLMELAGEFAASVVAASDPKRVLILVGFGNNGGDGWVAADILAHKGIDVDVVSPVEPDEIPAALARHVARRTAGRDVNIVIGPSRDELAELVSRADVVVDAILGTGFHGSLRSPFSIWIPTVNELAAEVVAIDVPSGLDAETGLVEEDAIRAARTATMLAPKIGLYSADGPDYTGEILCGELYERLDEVIDDVDHAAEMVEPIDLIDFLEPLPSNIDKYSRGSVLVVAGSSSYPGAAIMAAKAAARAGAGYVAVATPATCANLIRMALPSVPVIDIPADSRGAFGAAARRAVCDAAKKFSCVLCGPGITTAAGCIDVVSGLLKLDVPLVLDADALNCLSKLSIGGLDETPELYRREAPLILTPHYRELSRLVDEEAVRDLGGAIEAAQRLLWAAGSDNFIVIAKGPVTAVAGVEKVLLPVSGPASMATAGTGDVLSGIVAGTVALNHAYEGPWELLCSYAVSLHSYTGFIAADRYGEKSVIATDLIDVIGDAMALASEEALKGLEDVPATTAKGA
ncbi:NAD(P)H-hydrate dehydratase [uncultured Enorma sp.]|uniref:NAD(P)H-hydrate dehydratase n=1 Tax=uncultured Enorma sp. TaxID=1714346 RepID=UPI0025928EB2|nr:NAD(P)H-hydrate dehydratase [uncultured Enorma sp.]